MDRFELARTLVLRAGEALRSSRLEEGEIQAFLYAFFPFLFGVYPYTEATEKQKAAMEAAGIDAPRFSIYELTRSLAARLLRQGPA